MQKTHTPINGADARVCAGTLLRRCVEDAEALDKGADGLLNIVAILSHAEGALLRAAESVAEDKGTYSALSLVSRAMQLACEKLDNESEKFQRVSINLGRLRTLNIEGLSGEGPEDGN